MPKIDDEFASNASEFNTLKELKEHIKAHIEEHKTKSVEVEAENKLVDEIVKKAKVDVPKAMVEHQIDHTIEDISQRLAYQGIKFEQYLEYMGTTMADFRKSREKEAENSVKTSLVLEEIIKKENIKVTDKDIKAKLEEIAKATKRNVTDLEREMKNGQEEFLKNTILSEKVINRLKELNNIK